MYELRIIVCLVLLNFLGTSTAWGWSEEQQFGPYLIRSEYRLRDSQGLADELGDLQADIERQLGLKCEPIEIQIHLFRGRRSYESYLRLRGLAGMKRQALFVQGKDASRIYVHRHYGIDGRDQSEVDVRHETTHALLHSSLPFVPVWLDEGVAEYFEVLPGQREKQNPHFAELKRAIRFGWRPELERLEAINNLAEMNTKEEYRDAWGIVHFVLHGPAPAREALCAYFREVQSGQVPEPLSQHLRRRIPNLEQSIVDHLK